MSSIDPWESAFPFLIDPPIQSDKTFGEMFAWCRARWGDPAFHPQVEAAPWASTLAGMRFRSINDAFEFKMRWC